MAGGRDKGWIESRRCPLVSACPAKTVLIGLRGPDPSRHRKPKKRVASVAMVVIVLLFDYCLICSLMFAFRSVPFHLFVAAVAIVAWCGLVWSLFLLLFLLFVSLLGFHFLLLLLCCAIFMACFIHCPLYCCSCLDVWFTPTISSAHPPSRPHNPLRSPSTGRTAPLAESTLRTH